MSTQELFQSFKSACELWDNTYIKTSRGWLQCRRNLQQQNEEAYVLIPKHKKDEKFVPEICDGMLVFAR